MTQNREKTGLVLGVAFIIGLLGAALITFHGFKLVKQSQRYVTVKGLAEKTVPADLAIWTIGYTVNDNDLADANEKIIRHTAIIKDFLLAHGFTADEIKELPVEVEDRVALNYREYTYRFALSKKLKLRTKAVNQVEQASIDLGELLNQEISISHNSVPKFLFTGLNEKKPAMLAEATKNARLAAEKFAKDSESSVGQIRSARQGSFQILHPDSIPGEEYLVQQSESLLKRLRVVTTLEFFLED